MVRNKGIIPSGPTEISIQRKQLKAIIDSLLPACIEPDLETGIPFRAQAIIANPTACGEWLEPRRLLHYVFLYFILWLLLIYLSVYSFTYVLLQLILALIV